MSRRIAVAGVAAGIARRTPDGAGPVAADALGRWLRAGGTALVALVVLAALVVLVHQYRRWREYRPAIHVAAILVAFVVGTALWLDASAPAATSGALSSAEASMIRAGALALLFAVLLTIAHHFDGDGR